jgi:hypothetical protein
MATSGRVPRFEGGGKPYCIASISRPLSRPIRSTGGVLVGEDRRERGPIGRATRAHPEEPSDGAAVGVMECPRHCRYRQWAL